MLHIPVACDIIFKEARHTENDQVYRLGPKLKIISNSFRRIADESTHELGITGMQSFLLGYLRRNTGDPPCQHDIEVRFNIKHPTAAGLMARLGEKGYVDFAPDKYDRRLKRLILTDAGKKAAEQTKARLDLMEERLTRGFSQTELDALHGYLDRLVENAKLAAGCCRHQEGE